jgi:hypothetical protein
MNQIIFVQTSDHRWLVDKLIHVLSS